VTAGTAIVRTVWTQGNDSRSVVKVTDPTAFLSARLDEDEQEAASFAGPPSLRDRQRREVEAKRAILAIHRPVWNDYVDGDGIERATHECRECRPPGTPDNWPCRTVKALAAVWSDHPDYRQEWRP
jgi:Family of unknown function (DUF6221)